MQRLTPQPRAERRSLCVRRFAPESNEHVETAADAPADALLVVSKDDAKSERARVEALSKAEAELQEAKAREAALEQELAGAVSRGADAESDAEDVVEAQADEARIRREIAKVQAEQEKLTREISLRSVPSTTTIAFMFRRRAGELGEDARLAGAMLVPVEGEPIPLRFEGGNAGRGVAMMAEVPFGTTGYVALHLVGLAGVEVEVVLLAGGTNMSVPA